REARWRISPQRPANREGRKGGDRDPKGNSLWLLPSGPDQVGEAFARDLQGQYRGLRRRNQGLPRGRARRKRAAMAIPAINTFSGNPLDRAGDRRNDEAWLAAQHDNPEALAMVLWEGRPLIEAHPDGPRLAWLRMDRAMDIALDRRAFLGLWKAAPVFAVELEGSVDPTAGPLQGLGAFHEMRAAAGLLPGPEAAMAGAAKSLFDWRRRHGFCAACGQPSRDAGGGWRRVCAACGTEHFPRVDPVVIMLAV